MVPECSAPKYSVTMPSAIVTELAQRVVRDYITDLARNGPADISSFTDDVLKFEAGDMSLATEVDQAAIRILQQIGKDLLTP